MKPITKVVVTTKDGREITYSGSGTVEVVNTTRKNGPKTTDLEPVRYVSLQMELPR